MQNVFFIEWCISCILCRLNRQRFVLLHTAYTKCHPYKFYYLLVMIGWALKRQTIFEKKITIIFLHQDCTPAIPELRPPFRKRQAWTIFWAHLESQAQAPCSRLDRFKPEPSKKGQALGRTWAKPNLWSSPSLLSIQYTCYAEWNINKAHKPNHMHSQFITNMCCAQSWCKKMIAM